MGIPLPLGASAKDRWMAKTWKSQAVSLRVFQRKVALVDTLGFLIQCYKTTP